MLEQVLIIVGVTVMIMISPGPDMILVARNTIIGTRGDGLLTSLGVLCGNMVHMTYCAVGVGQLISQSIIAFTVLKIAGAAYLIYLGITSFRAKEMALEAAAVGSTRANRSGFLQGFVNNILNPKGPLFYLGLFTVIITPETSLGQTLVLVAVSLSVSGLFWLLFVTTLDRRPVRAVFDRGQRLISRIFGVLLISLGLRLAFAER